MKHALLFRIVLCFSCILASVLPGKAQQRPASSFYRASWQIVNPAAIDRSLYLTTKHNTLVFNSGFRQQWLGIDGAPQTYFASVEWCPERGKYEPGMKLGGTLIRDKTDAIGTTSFLANYAYHFVFGAGGGNSHILHLGLSGRINEYRVDTESLRYKQLDDPTINALAAQPNYLFGDVAFGMMYRLGQHYYLGLSVPSTFKTSFSEKEGGLDIAKEIRRHIFLSTGGFIPFGPSDPKDRSRALWMLEPSFWMRMVPGVQYSSIFNGAPFSFDANMRIHYGSKVWFGAGYGSNQMGRTELGFIIRRTSQANKVGTRLQAGIAYNFPAGSKYLALGHSVEFTLSYWGL